MGEPSIPLSQFNGYRVLYVRVATPISRFQARGVVRGSPPPPKWQLLQMRGGSRSGRGPPLVPAGCDEATLASATLDFASNVRVAGRTGGGR